MSFSPLRGSGRGFLLGVLILALAAVGCGAGSGTVTGTVTYNGTPLKGGNVTFLGADKQSRMSPIGEDGKYTIEKVAVGTAKIAVETESLAQMSRMPSYGPPKGATTPGDYKPADPKAALKRYTKIPLTYADAENSGLTYNVKKGTQQYPIDLK